MRDYIIEGHLDDGARVPERELCELFGVSRTPMRDALKRLLELLPNRGAGVRSLSQADLVELFNLIGGLEALAGRLACENISDTQVDEIERLHRDMYAFYLRKDMQGYFRCNQMIHHAIVAAARNSALTAAYASYGDRIKRIRYAANFAHQRDHWGEAIRAHEAMLDAPRRRVGGELSDLLFAHLRNKRIAATDRGEAVPDDK